MFDKTRDENRRRVEMLFETFNNGDLGRLDDLIAADYAAPQGGKGPDGFRKVVVDLRAAFPDIHYTVDETVAEGDRVAVHWHWTGTHRAPFRGFAPTGKVVSNPGLAVFRLQGGRIVASVLETDRLGFLQQIGAVPPNVGLGPGPSPGPTASAAQ